MRKWIVLCLFFSTYGFSEFSIETVSSSPKILLISNFVSDEECSYLIRTASSKLTRSELVDEEGISEGVIDDRRTSEGAFFVNFEEAILKTIEKRIAELTHIPIHNGEPLQVLHYKTGGEFTPHHDYFDVATPGGKACADLGGQRQASLVIYLNTPEEGGETIFPDANISITPKKGNALLFYNCLPSGEVDPLSLHAGAPVLKGEKWIANKWLRLGRLR